MRATWCLFSVFIIILILGEIYPVKAGDEGKGGFIEDILEKKKDFVDKVIEKKKDFVENVLEKKKEIVDDVLYKKKEIVDDVLYKKKEIVDDVLYKKKDIVDDVIYKKKDIVDDVLYKKKEIVDDVLYKKKEIDDDVIYKKKDIIDDVLYKKKDIVDDVLDKKKDIFGNLLDKKKDDGQYKKKYDDDDELFKKKDYEKDKKKDDELKTTKEDEFKKKEDDELQKQKDDARRKKKYERLRRRKMERLRKKKRGSKKTLKKKNLSNYIRDTFEAAKSKYNDLLKYMVPPDVLIQHILEDLRDALRKFLEGKCFELSGHLRYKREAPTLYQGPGGTEPNITKPANPNVQIEHPMQGRRRRKPSSPISATFSSSNSKSHATTNVIIKNKPAATFSNTIWPYKNIIRQVIETIRDVMQMRVILSIVDGAKLEYRAMKEQCLEAININKGESPQETTVTPAPQNDPINEKQEPPNKQPEPTFYDY